MVMKEDNKENFPYEDIINLNHYVSNIRDYMPIKDRAAQFAPFAALKGYESEIMETARRTERRIVLDESEKNKLDEKFIMIQEQLSKHPQIELIYFQPDELKEGGVYISVSGFIKKIDEYERIIEMRDGKRIPIEEIVSITSELLFEE